MCSDLASFLSTSKKKRYLHVSLMEWGLCPAAEETQQVQACSLLAYVLLLARMSNQRTQARPIFFAEDLFWSKCLELVCSLMSIPIRPAHKLLGFSIAIITAGLSQGGEPGEVLKILSVGHRLNLISRIQEKTLARNFCSFSSEALQ